MLAQIINKLFGRKQARSSRSVSAGSPTDLYARNVEVKQSSIQESREVIPELLAKGNFAWAATNHRLILNSELELGLLHWRRGIDPRPDFENATRAFEALRNIVAEHGLAKSDYSVELAYALLSLMGQTQPVEFLDEGSFEEYRVYCYRTGLVLALHDQPVPASVARLIERHLAENNELMDRSFQTYFRLLGLRPSGYSRDALVGIADQNWLDRQYSDFEDGLAFEGGGDFNDLYIDILLAAVLKKIGWQGESIHRWRWGEQT